MPYMRCMLCMRESLQNVIAESSRLILRGEVAHQHLVQVIHLVGHDQNLSAEALAGKGGSPVRALAFGPQGTKLLVGSADFGVRLFAVDEGDRVQAAFSAFGKVYVEREKASRIIQ